MAHPDPEEIEARRKEFNKWWVRYGVAIVSRLPSSQQAEMHKLLRRAYRDGIRFEAKKHEPIRLGGMN